MKESHQKEYDALGLPWHTEKASPLDISCEIDGLEMNLFLNQTDSDEVSRFAVKAANSHHALVDRVERLRELLMKILIRTDIESLHKDISEEIEEALKETEPTK